MGLQRGEPGTGTTAEKIGAALHNGANDHIKRDIDKPWEQLPERNRSSTYVGTNVSEFTPGQQEAIKSAIMGASEHKNALPNGLTFNDIEDVKFEKGRNGAVVIEVQGNTTMEVDYKKLKD